MRDELVIRDFRIPSFCLVHFFLSVLTVSSVVNHFFFDRRELLR